MGGVAHRPAAARHAIPTPSASITRRGARAWPRTSSRSIGCKLDGYVYPAIQMPPPDETMPQDGRLSGGPHSDTSWVNMIGVPAVVVPAGTYPSGLPFGLEFSARPWTDGDLLAIADGVGAGDAAPPAADRWSSAACCP